jgi:peptide/nickel transport system permease protein
VLAISDWVIYARVIRGRTIVEEAKDYIVAARALGASDVRIVFRHIMPNVLPTLLVVATVQLGLMILMESSLSYLGLGVQRPSPTWGRMIGDGQTYLRDAWWMSTMPGMAIACVVLGINLISDGLRKVWKME